MPKLPIIDATHRIERLIPPEKKIAMVLDTDTYNEIDDQFAIVYALLSPERLEVEAIYAAPFLNGRASSPENGMEQSYDEILRLLERLNRPAKDFVFKGAKNYLPSLEQPVESPAVDDLIARAMAPDRTEPLYVVSIGAITNIASAILKEPKIIEHIVVVWLGGQPLTWPHTHEFNLHQDITGTRFVLDCGVPLVMVPCKNVAEHLLSTVAELEHHVRGHSLIGDFLCDRFAEYSDDHYAWSKEIWDIAPIAWLINPSWVPSALVHSPILTSQITWSLDQSRHWIRIATELNRNAIFRDMFTKLENFGQSRQYK